MASASRVWRVYVLLGGTGVVVALAAAVVAVTRVNFSDLSLAGLAEACREWALNGATATSVLVLALSSLGVAVAVVTGRAAARQVVAGWRFEHRLPVVAPLPGVARAYVIDDEQPQAFCVGLLRARIYISRGAKRLLSDDELDAVIAHESHHARRRDPLRLLVARSLAEGLFFLPVMPQVAERYAVLAELAADEAAVRATRGPRALASALLAFDAHPSPSVVGIAPERVDHLLGQRARWELPTLVLLAGTAVVASLLALTVRMADVAGEATVGLPVLVAQACMVAMAAVPLMIGASALIGGRRVLRRFVARWAI